MKEISLENFRCFRDRQTVRLAPLTLLVGENSAGKTSFMALVRALWNIAYQNSAPDFKTQSYDLGAFDEIAHHRGAKGGARKFSAAFKVPVGNGKAREPETLEYEIVFQKRGSAPFPRQTKLSMGTTWIEHRIKSRKNLLYFGTDRGSWEISSGLGHFSSFYSDRQRLIFPFRVWFSFIGEVVGVDELGLINIEGNVKPHEEDYEKVRSLSRAAQRSFTDTKRAYASAPVRSVPRCTYDPEPAKPDPGGQYVPMYLTKIYSEDAKEWERLKRKLERFGQDAGLFDEISIRTLGNRDSEPFQLQVRKFAGSLKGPRRNLIDVGYGVSQALPVVTGLMRKNPPSLSLLQQPEVHLHPSAQAALGTQFCQIAGHSQQLIVETHSDHLVDRVRMDIRDRNTKLKPEDVSILFFDRKGLNVQIHSIRLDEMGNIDGAPDTYRRFFLEETSRSIGI